MLRKIKKKSAVITMVGASDHTTATQNSGTHPQYAQFPGVSAPLSSSFRALAHPLLHNLAVFYSLCTIAESVRGGIGAERRVQV